MSLTIAQVVFDCQDAEKLGGFWAAVLDRPLDPGASSYFATIGRQDERLTLMFLKVPEPKQLKNRLHLDLSSDDWAAELKRVTELGAAQVGEFREYGIRWFTLRDPEGNEFDLGAGLDGEPAAAG
jgi:predicted enzyme related to lactoylglutathione lyase